jgi:small subunit ribosomal protein S16
MVKIRLMRVGMKGAPSYRVVVADARSPRDGRIIENIGWYNPLTEPSTITIDTERAQHWLSVGAQPTDSVRSLLQRAGIIPRAVPSTAESSTAESSTAESSTAKSSTAESSTAKSSTAKSSTAKSSTAKSSTAKSSTAE